MKKVIGLGIGMLLLVSCLLVSATGNEQVQAGESSIVHVYLNEKDPATWNIVEDGAWGKLTYNVDSGKFVFNGHKLNPETEYTLINFARVGSEWPATVNILGFATSDEDGNVHIMGTYAYNDLDFDTTPGSGSELGYKIWLVKSTDIISGKLAGWTPSDILFEANLIPIGLIVP